ncbi:MAG: hypothetical protein HN368_11330 [Spirochaetales bacterium]|jgi:hypothetical protein|nr:hypothetical protein [Spirochaetales bacterium]
MSRCIAVILTLLILGQPIFAQQAPRRGDESTESTEEVEQYEPYTDDEFPVWMHTLRRAEVLFIGSFPITMLFSSLAFNGVRGTVSALNDAGALGSAEYVPENWSSAESVTVLITGLGLSAAVAIFDYLLGRRSNVENE